MNIEFLGESMKEGAANRKSRRGKKASDNPWINDKNAETRNSPVIAGEKFRKTWLQNLGTCAS